MPDPLGVGTLIPETQEDNKIDEKIDVEDVPDQESVKGDDECSKNGVLDLSQVGDQEPPPDDVPDLSPSQESNLEPAVDNLLDI